MKLPGFIERQRDGWYAECELIAAYTQGKSLADAKSMLADCIEALLNADEGAKNVKVTIAETDVVGKRHLVEVEASDPARLARRLLVIQRVHHDLSLADVAKRLGTTNRHGYATYERGISAPSLNKFVELLNAVAPDLALTVEKRKPTKSAPPKRKAGRSRRAA